MKIYTKTGDGGDTGLFGGDRVAKDSMRMSAIGTVDELNAMLGICRSFGLEKGMDGLVGSIQDLLFVVGSDLATPLDAEFDVPRIAEEDIVFLEQRIDKIDAVLPRLKQFILPGGGRAGSQIHLARAVCRRAERAVWGLARSEALNEIALSETAMNESILSGSVMSESAMYESVVNESVINESMINEMVPKFLNRLSDLLFVLARAVNLEEGSEEEKWEGM